MSRQFTIRSPFLTIFFALGFMVFDSLAQYPQYPKDYFMFPIKPGQQNYLAGTMGELRSNHFHGGIDVKTDQKTGLPVYAAADGYISRIVVSSRGYGNALYIIHPNGLMTVYAHLEWFKGAIGEKIKGYLYKNQCNETDLQLLPGELLVKKGDTVALSGNSGSSGGPHLHFEIRDQAERLMNPLFFGFEEIKDDLKPYVNKIAIRTLDINSRVEGEFGRYEFTPVLLGGEYALRYPIHGSGVLGVELVAYDHMNGTSNKCGLSLLEMKMDGKEVFVHDIQKIDFDDNPYINLHLDYQTYKNKGNYFQRCYVTDGNCLNTYCLDPMRGRLVINDTITHKIEITMYDAYRNKMLLKFKIKGTPKFPPKQLPTSKFRLGIKPEEYENTLKLTVYGNQNPTADLYIKGQKRELTPSYKRAYEQVYLWDLRTALPDSFVAGNQTHRFGFNELIPSKSDIVYTHQHMDIQFPKKALFDTVFLDLDYVYGLYTIHDPSIPLYSGLIVTLKPMFDVPFKTKTAVYNVSKGRSLHYSGGEWKGNTITFKTKYFGDFALAIDTIPPTLKFKKKVGNTAYFTINDASGIAQWFAFLNGEFLLMHYDPKYNVIFSNAKEGTTLDGELLIGVVDNLGNIRKQTFKF